MGFNKDGARRRKRRGGKRAKPLRLSEYDIPQDVVKQPGDFKKAPVHQQTGRRTLFMCAQHGNSDGLIIVMRPTSPQLLDLLGTHLPHHTDRYIHNIDPDMCEHKDMSRVHDYHDEDSIGSLDDLLVAHADPISVIFIGKHHEIVLDRIKDRLVPGTALVFLEEAGAAVAAWAKDNDKVLHAIARSLEPVMFAALVAN